jgi:hypothetical protein
MHMSACTLVYCKAYSTMKLKAICSSETSVDARSTERHIQEDDILHSTRCFIEISSAYPEIKHGKSVIDFALTSCTYYEGHIQKQLAQVVSRWLPTAAA